MDKIFLRDLTVMTIVGTLEHERHTMRPLRLNIQLECDLKPAGRSDDLFLSVNYQDVADKLLDFGRRSNYLLIEAFAEHASQLILNDFPLVQSVTVSVDKPGAIGAAASVAVEITRSR